jgi:hypothetical protein
VLWLGELKIMRGRNVQTQYSLQTATAEQQTANVASLQTNNPIIQMFSISQYLALAINP